MLKISLSSACLIMAFSASLFAQVSERGIKLRAKNPAANRWAICIGINNYDDNNINKLKKATSDAWGLSSTLREQGDFRVFTFADLDSMGRERSFGDNFFPTKQKIERFLESLSGNRDISPNDLVIFSFSGHGISDAEGKGYLIPIDWSIDKMYETAIPCENIEKWLKSLEVSRSLLLLDACRNELTSTRSVTPIERLYDQKFDGANISAVFYATRKGGFSYEDPDSPYGVFTKYLIGGLTGAGDQNRDSLVTFRELADFVENGVNDWAIQKGFSQRPFTKFFGEQTGNLALTVGSAYNFNPVIAKKQGGSVYLEISESPLNAENRIPRIETYLKKLLFDNSYEMSNEKAKANYHVLIKTNSRKGADVFGISTVSVDLIFSLYDLSSGNEIAVNNLTNIKGSGTNVEIAEIRALDKAAAEIGQTILTELRKSGAQ